MLLNKVVVGRGYKLTGNKSSLTAPPAGYDSVSIIVRLLFGGALTKVQVLGEVGGRLNHDELVVYDNDAVRPSYLVMYDTPE